MADDPRLTDASSLADPEPAGWEALAALTGGIPPEQVDEFRAVRALEPIYPLLHALVGRSLRDLLVRAAVLEALVQAGSGLRGRVRQVERPPRAGAHLCPQLSQPTLAGEHPACHHQTARASGPDRGRGARWSGLRNARYPSYPLTSTVVATAVGSVRNAYRRAADERRAALRLAKQLAEEKHRAERATRLRDEVLAVVSHDLKSPIALIAVTADLLDRRCTTHGLENLAEKARTIRRATVQAERLILDLLDAASIEAGRLSVRLASQPIAPMVQEALESVRATIDSAAPELTLDIVPGLPDVQCDRGRVV
jgi:signal transduction histidine kinase